jgi:hypothetical protein
MSSVPAATDIALNSIVSSSDHTSDEDDLKTLKLMDSDLDHFATYFEAAFQGRSENITVLVGLLQRLCGVEKLRYERQSGVWLRDIVGRLTHCLYARSDSGFEAASRFGSEASDLAEHIFSEALAGHERVVGFVAARSK